MQGKTENIRNRFKVNKKIFPLSIAENIQLSSHKSALHRGAGRGGGGALWIFSGTTH